MAKTKRSSGSSGLRKNHGPKRHLHKDYKPMVHVIAKAGLLSKYSDKESFILACTARGVKHNYDALWSQFALLKTKAEKDAWFKNLNKAPANA